jgi:hypothetical protein
MCNLWTHIHGLGLSVALFALRVGNEVKSRKTPCLAEPPSGADGPQRRLLELFPVLLLWAAAHRRR